jgi:hypothetical protein
MIPFLLLLILHATSAPTSPFAGLRSVSLGPPSSPTRKLAVSDSQPPILYVTLEDSKGGLLRGNREEPWTDLAEGPTGGVVIDPKSGAIFAAGLSNVFRVDPRTRQVQNVSPVPHDPSTKQDLTYRFASQPPLAFSRHEEGSLYLGANVLLRSTNGGYSWDSVSNELTRNDQKGAAPLGTLTCVAESPLNPRIIWVGSDNGVLQVTENRASSWTSLSSRLPGFMAGKPIHHIELSPWDEAAAYIIARDSSQHPLWKTTDLGQTWKKIDSGLPKNLTAKVLRCDPLRKGLLYLGTDHGLWISMNDGEKWEQITPQVSHVDITDLALKDQALFAVGRGVHRFDFLNVLREWSEPIAEKPFHLFSIPTTTRWLPTSHLKHGVFTAADSMIPIHFYLKKPIKKSINFEIINTQGVKVFSKRVEQTRLKDLIGVQSFAWDLRHLPPTSIDEAVLGTGKELRGPRVSPGTYTLRFTVDGESQEVKFEVVPDPRHPGPSRMDLLDRPVTLLTVAPRVAAEQSASPPPVPWLSRVSSHELLLAEYRHQEGFCLGLRDILTRISQTTTQIHQLEEQLRKQQEVLAVEPKVADLLQKSRQIHNKLGKLTSQMYRQTPKDTRVASTNAELYSQFATLLHFADQSDSPPTQGMRKRAESLEKEMAGRMLEYKKICEEDLPALNELARAKNMPIIWIPDSKRK